MGCPKYLLGIEVAHKKYSVLLSQRKYTLDLLEETGFLNYNTLIEANVNLWFDDSHTLDNPGRYRRLIGRVIYLTVIRSNITLTVGIFSRFMYQPRETHWLVMIRILIYIKSCSGKDLVYRKYGYVRISEYSGSGYTGDRGDRNFTTGYCTFVGENMVT